MSAVDTVTHAIAEIFIRIKYLIHTQLNVEWRTENTYASFLVHIWNLMESDLLCSEEEINDDESTEMWVYSYSMTRFNVWCFQNVINSYHGKKKKHLLSSPL